MSKFLDQKREQRLIRQAAAGDREAAGELIKLHQTSVYAYILRSRGVLRCRGGHCPGSLLRPRPDQPRPLRPTLPLLDVAVHHRPARVPEPLRELPAGLRLGENSPRSPKRSCGINESWDDRDDQDHNRDRVQRALMLLSLEQREVIVLFHQHEWPIWLIAEHLGIPEGTVKSHLHRGRSKLRDALTEPFSAAGLSPAFSPLWLLSPQPRSSRHARYGRCGHD